VLGHRFNANGNLAGAKFDWNDALGLGKREERIGHQILRLARRKVTRKRAEQIELFAFRTASAPHVMLPGHQRRALPA
jgi:hypothetical protein